MAKLSGFLRPVNNDCIDCNHAIDPKAERNYIVYDQDKQEYRRECAKCHDKAKGFILGRHTATDGMIKAI